MTSNFILFFLIFSIFTIYIFKKNNLLADIKSERHKRFSSKTKSHFLGGILLIIFFYQKFIIENENIFLISFLTSIFLIGFFSDLKKINSVSLRFFIQLIIIFLFSQLIQLEINNTKILIIDELLKNIYINIFFVVFCLMILVNGSNFIDGINGLLVSYYLLIFLIILFNFQNFSYVNENFLIDLVFVLFIILIINTAGLIYMGDSGAYLLSTYAGIYLIKFSYFNYSISPYFIIVLLWYPCFELLFSMIRRNFKKNKTYKPDTIHLHQLLFSFINKKLTFKNNLLNHFFTTLIINIYNLLIFLFSINYIYNSEILIIILFVNIFSYLLSYYLLKKNLKNYIK